MNEEDVIREVEELDDDSLIELYDLVVEHLTYLKENVIDISTDEDGETHEE